MTFSETVFQVACHLTPSRSRLFRQNLAHILTNPYDGASVSWDKFIQDYPEAAGLREFLDDAT